MFKLKKALSTLITALLFTLAALNVVTATSVIVPSDDEMIIGARAIVRGTVTGVSSHYDEPHRAIFTYITLQVSEVFKGQITTSEIVLKEPGGVTPEAASIIFGTPEFQPGEDVLLYLDTWADGSLRVHQWFLGNYLISAGGPGIGQLITRALGGEKISILGRAKGKITDRAELENYLAMVRTRVAALHEASAQHEARYFSDVAVQAMPVERLDQTGGAEHFTLLHPNYPVRWFEPDAGLPVTFKINLSGAPNAGSADDIVAAMNAWSSVSGSALRVASGGQTNGCGLLSTDGENTISFNNCDNYSAFSPGGGCSGVLAAAGIIRFTFMTRVVNGTNFYQALEGNVAFSPYATCHLSNSCKAREIATHELGHALGFGHSQDASSTMYAVTHFDGRCASLRADDQEGVRFIYPGTGAPPPPPPAPSSLLITTGGLSNAQVGVYYSQTLSATGGTPSYAWSLANGALPAGLGLQADGSVSGTPATSGTFSFTARVADAAGQSAQITLSLVVANAPPSPPPPPPPPPSASLVITTTSLPDAQTATHYSQRLTVSGGTAPYTWSWSEGTFMFGLSISPDGIISGVPFASGSYSFTVRVRDATGATARVVLTLNIVASDAPSFFSSGLGQQSLSGLVKRR